MSDLRTLALRLRPGQDLKRELHTFTEQHRLQAGFILTCVGSLRQAALRLANQPGTTRYEDKFEIVALVGTLCPDGAHLHIALSDGQGRTIGGHVQEGNLIYTTAEIVIGELTQVRFRRSFDAETGYDELAVIPNVERANG
jgi:predicted DNA-binding protein with PD1-like motif